MKSIVNFGTYTLSSIIQASIPFFILPILTTYLSPSDYGILSMFTLVTTFLNPFIGLSSVNFIQRKFFEVPKEVLANYITKCLSIAVVTLIFVFIIFGIFNLFLGRITHLPFIYILLAVLFCFSNYVNSIFLVLLQVRKKALQYGLFQILNTLLNVILTLFALIILHKNWQGRIIAIVISTFSFSLFVLVVIFKNGFIQFKNLSKNGFKEIVLFSVPLIPHTLGAYFIGQSDRYFIANLISLESTGIYSVAIMLASIVSIINVSFNNVFSVWLYEKLKLNIYTFKIKIVAYSYLYILFVIIIVVIGSLIGPYLLKYFIGAKFIESISLFKILIWSYVFQAMYFMSVNYIIYIKKTKLLAMITISVGLLNFCSMYFSIKYLGVNGAAFTCVFTWFVFSVFTFILSFKLYKMPWAINKKLLYEITNICLMR